MYCLWKGLGWLGATACKKVGVPPGGSPRIGGCLDGGPRGVSSTQEMNPNFVAM